MAGPSRRQLVMGLPGAASLAVAPQALAQDATSAPPPTINLLSVLTPEERADAESGADSRDITLAWRALIKLSPPGTTIDATGLRGVVTLTADLFDLADGQGKTLLTGDVTLRKDFNQGPLALPSNFTWRRAGTVVRPSTAVRAIPLDSSPATAMVVTQTSGGTCSGLAGQTSVLVDRSSEVLPGAQFAILGGRIDEDVQLTLAAAVAPYTKDFAFDQDTSALLRDSTVYLLIDREVVRGIASDGRFTVQQRGDLGSLPDAHAKGAAVSLLRSAVFHVVSKTDFTVTLSGPLPRTLSKAIFRTGAVNSVLAGTGLIDGEFDPASAKPLPWLCLASTLSSGFRVEPGTELRRASHGGLMAFGCERMEASINRINRTGRPKASLGASVWLFGANRDCAIRVGQVSDGYLAVAIDNKSNGVSFFGLEGPNVNCSVDIDSVVTHAVGLALSGSSGNHVRIRALDAAEGSVVITDGDRQTTRPIAATDNEVVIDSEKAPHISSGDALSRNSVRRGGKLDRGQ